jgi:hypothetical protein
MNTNSWKARIMIFPKMGVGRREAVNLHLDCSLIFSTVRFSSFNDLRTTVMMEEKKVFILVNPTRRKKLQKRKIIPFVIQ